ncbi:MAG: DMT family transporter, partial [Janthinobacterium lividum]
MSRLVAPFFVLIWATGFIAARLVAPHVQPLGFLCLRYAVASAVLGAMAVLSGARWPRGRGWRDTVVAGLLIQAGYLGGVFWAVRHGLPAGLSALIVGLQPLLTAALAWRLLGERVGGRRWAGIALGFAGAGLVVAPVLLASVGGGRTVPPAAVAVCLGAMVSITLGTIWQKRTGGAGDLRTALAVQYAASLAVTAPVALVLEGGAQVFDG